MKNIILGCIAVSLMFVARPSVAQYVPQRNPTFCLVVKQACWSGCDPATFGLDKDWDRIHSCRQSCESDYSRCMGR